MSLINDALKKAQKQQTQQPVSSASVSPFSAPAASRPGVVMSFERMLLLVVTLVVVIVGATAVGVLLVRRDDRPVAANLPYPAAPEPTVATAAAPASPAPPAPPPAATSTPVKISSESPAAASIIHPAASVPTTVATPAAVTAPAPVPVIAVAPARSPAATRTPSSVSTPPTAAPTVSVNLGSARATASANVGSTPPPTAIVVRPVPPPPANPTKNPKILSFLENARIGGIRLAGDDSKVVLNDHVYRANNIVSVELGLRLTAVGATTLTFVDENGFVYTKTF